MSQLQQQRTVYLATSAALRTIPQLETFLQAAVTSSIGDKPTAVLGWGRKPSALKAERAALRHGLDMVRIEDGFIRSMGLGANEPPLSIVIDDLGIYYDAQQPSRLEQLVGMALSDAEQQRAQQLIDVIRVAKISKYNQARDYTGSLPADYVLLIDQTHGDASIHFGMADASSYSAMLTDAAKLFPDSPLVIKKHPDVVAGFKQGCFDQIPAALQARVTIIAEDAHPPSLLEHARAVFCVTSQVGFEALIWGKPVHCYGAPFYAGWGLTVDHSSALFPRRKPVSLAQLVHAALIRYARYIHPEHPQQLCEVETLIEWLAWQRQQQCQYAEVIYAKKFPRWKRGFVQTYLSGSRIEIVDNFDTLPAGATLLVWGAGEVSVRGSVKLLRLEDGFIRSVGLGADLIAPCSWVIDEIGMYYDATQPSGLERLLATTAFDADLTSRAARLRRRLVELDISKYNVGHGDWQRPPEQRVLLVPGQVESDKSIRFGSPVLRRNDELLQQVRQANPEAYIVYKPHPDVQAGLRKASVAEQQALQWCNEVVVDVDMANLLKQVDEVHTLTSLTGFEALLRDIPVVCYGQPFYSGWGLTEDRFPHPRRQRTLTLDELVAATLILYPRYVSPISAKLCTVEQVVEQLYRAKTAQPPLHWRRRLQRLLQRLKRF